jgi:nucleoid-associated protein YgaU
VRRQTQETADPEFQTGPATASNARLPFEQNDIQPDANRDQTPLENRAGSITTIQTPANDFKQELTQFEDLSKANHTADTFERPFDEGETGNSTDSDHNSQFDQNSVTRSKAAPWEKLPSSSGLGQIGTSRNAARRPFDSDSSTSLDEYTVQQNDSYWKISKKRYGTYRYFQALLMYNKDRIPDPRRMRPGMKIRTPDPQILHAHFPKAIPSGSGQGTVVRKSDSTDGNAATGFFVGKTGAPFYRIGPRDELARIAKRHLGRSSRWIQILNLNKSQLKNPHDLKIGTILKLPSDASDVQLVRRTP